MPFISRRKSVLPGIQALFGFQLIAVHQALQLKLDELIRVTKGRQNRMLNLEEMDEDHLERLQEIYERLANKTGPVGERTGKTIEQRRN